MRLYQISVEGTRVSEQGDLAYIERASREFPHDLYVGRAVDESRHVVYFRGGRQIDARAVEAQS